MNEKILAIHHFQNVQETLDLAEAQASTEWECDFVAGFQDRLRAFGNGLLMSSAQADIIENIIQG